MSKVDRFPVVMDVDTGVDDAIALAMAVMSDRIQLAGITTVAGNVNCDIATHNTLRVLEVLGATDVPVYRGMTRPLARVHVDATHFHGDDGLGGADFPAAQRGHTDRTAVEFIVQMARQYAGKLNLVFVGPLTNLAVALALEPALPELVDRTVIMGGAFEVPGNTTPSGEFNVVVDPEAARLVAESSLNATWVGLDVTHRAKLSRTDWESLAGDERPASRVVREVSRRRFSDANADSFYLHDPLAVGVLLDPDVVTTRDAAIWVDTSVRERAGATRMVQDIHAPSHRIALDLDEHRFRRIFDDTLWPGTAVT